METREYWERKDAQMAADIAAAREAAQSLGGRMAAARRQAEALDFARQDHGGASEADCAAAWATYQALADEQVARDQAALRAAGWTREATIARRATWNALVRSGALNGAGTRRTQIDMTKLRAQYQTQGWTAEDLKQAIALHQL